MTRAESEIYKVGDRYEMLVFDEDPDEVDDAVSIRFIFDTIHALTDMARIMIMQKKVILFRDLKHEDISEEYFNG